MRLALTTVSQKWWVARNEDGRAQPLRRWMTTMRLNCLLLFLVAGVVSGCQQSDKGLKEPSRTQLLIVVDGLRPDFVTADFTPQLHRLAQRGVIFKNHHAVFPTVTRVNAASISTGAYPRTHGLMGNSVFMPKVDSSSALSTGTKDVLDAIGHATDGQILTATTLGEVLQGAGKSLVVLSSGTEGSGLLLNHTVAGGAVIHPGFTLPESLRASLDATLGYSLPANASVAAQTRWLVDVYLQYVVEILQPDVTILWIGNLDGASHAYGVGSPSALEALTTVDAEIARIETTLLTSERVSGVNLLVASDHGFSSHTGELDLDSLLEPHRGALENGSPDIVRAGTAIYIRDSDLDKRDAIVNDLLTVAGHGAIFTPARGQDTVEGIVPGTFSQTLIGWNHARAADILISPAWTSAINEYGYAGTTSQKGIAGHGSASPFDIHAVLIAAGPDFREGLVLDTPTANVDLAPTLLYLLALGMPDSMEGRVITEALREGPTPSTVQTETRHHSFELELASGPYAASAQVSTLGEYVYLDHAEVQRP